MKQSLQKAFPALGTINTIRLYGENPLPAAERIKEYVLHLDRTLSVFRPESEISVLNKNAGIRPVSVGPDTLALLKESIRYSVRTGGAFDCTVGPLTALWRRCAKENRLPSKKEILQAKKRTGYPNLLPEEFSHTAMLCQTGASVDLGGIAKGYASDRIVEMLKEEGIENALLDLGGTITALGKEQTIGIQHPFAPTGTPMGTLTLKNLSAVTSGSYERFFTVNGTRFHHIIDPKTGRPSASDLCSVTLIGEHACELDALATGVFVLGMEKSLPLLKARNIEAIFVRTDGQVLLTDALKDSFRLAA